MIRLYGTAASRTARVLWTLEELGIAYEHRPVDHRTGENQSDSFRLLSPTGQIPVLVGDAGAVRQSMAINFHLAMEHQPNALMPADAAGRAAALEWTLWAATEVEPHSFLRLVEWPKDEAERDTAGLERADARLRLALDYLEGRLGEHEWLAATDFSIADLNAVGPLEYLQRSAFDFGNWPKVRSWLARAQARPAYTKVLAMKAAA